MRKFLLLLTMLLTACHAPLSKRTVVLISIDGFRPDYLNRGLTPTLQALANEGVRAQWMIPSFPTETYPNHYAMVTGLYPDHNGLVGNELEAEGLHATLTDRESTGLPLWFEQATPIWVSVHRAGGISATMLWPASEAPNHDIWPDYWRPYSRAIPERQRVDELLRWMQHKPNFVALYFDQVDYQGSLHGPDSQQVNAAIRNTDSAIGYFVSELKRRGVDADIIIVSDHGMTKNEHTVYLDDYTKDAIVMTGGIAGIKGNAPKLPHTQCWPKQDMPARFHYGTNSRIPQTICLAQDGWNLTTHSRAEHDLGHHGYDNADPFMRSLFIAEGPDFQRGYVAEPFPNVDVYLLLTRLLNVSPESNDGNIADVRAMLR